MPHCDSSTVGLQPQWLSPTEQQVWRQWLQGSARIERYLDQMLRPDGLDAAKYEILVVLSESAGRECRMSSLAQGVHQSRSRLTHTITRMERDGLVTRHPAPGDGRGVVARLTDEGFSLLVRLAPGHVQAVRDVFIDVVAPADLEAIGRAMHAVLTSQPPEAVTADQEAGHPDSSTEPPCVDFPAAPGGPLTPGS